MLKENRSALMGFIIRMILAVVAAAALTVFAAPGLVSSIPFINVDLSKASEAPSMQEIATSSVNAAKSTNWILSKREKSGEEVIKFVLSRKDGSDSIEIHFAPRDPHKPCYAATKLFNISYKSTAVLTQSEESLIADVIKEERANELTAKPPKKSLILLKTFRISLLGSFFLIIFLVFYDASHLVLHKRKRPVSGGEKKAEAAGIRRTELIFGTGLFLFFFLLMSWDLIRNTVWDYFSINDYYFFASLNPNDINNIQVFWGYVFTDIGLPVIPFRLILIGMTKLQSLASIRLMLALFAPAAAAAVYVFSARNMRASIAWIPPVLFLANGTLTAWDIRGYTFFLFFGALSVALYDSQVKKIEIKRFLALDLSILITVLSNPLMSVLFPGFMLYELIGLKKKELTSEARIGVVVRLVCMAALFVLLVPLFAAITTRHTAETRGVITNPVFDFNIMISMLSAIIFACAAVYFRKDTRGAVMLSALTGVAAVAVLIYTRILFNREQYFLFVFPVAFVGAGIIADEALSALERRFPGLSRIASFAAAICVAAYLLISVNFGGLIGATEQQAMESTFASADRVISSKNIENAPVLVYPIDTMMPYISYKYKIDYFRDVVTKKFKISKRKIRSGKVIEGYKNYYSIETPLFDPADEFGSNIYVLSFSRKDMKSRAFLEAISGGGRRRAVKINDSPLIYYVMK